MIHWKKPKDPLEVIGSESQGGTGVAEPAGVSPGQTAAHSSGQLGLE